MSFCSYEEAWGSPFNPHQNYDHVTKTKENENTKDIVLEKNNDPVSENGMVETAPLRGSLLGGAIPAEQWKTNEVQDTQDEPVHSFEAKFDKKIDQLIKSIESCSNRFKQPTSYNTSWTDVLVFIALGIAAYICIRHVL